MRVTRAMMGDAGGAGDQGDADDGDDAGDETCARFGDRDGGGDDSIVQQ